jgi:hypothetical protein
MNIIKAGPVELVIATDYVEVYVNNSSLGTVDTTFTGIKRMVLTAVLVAALTILVIMAKH